MRTAAFLVHFYTVPDAAKIFAILENRRLELGLSQAEVSRRAFGKSDSSALQNIKRGSSPSADKLAALCAVLDLDFHFGSPLQRSGKASFSPVDTLPHHGLAKCGVHGWGKDQPDRPPLPKPEFINDPEAFYVSASGQSMIPEGIEGGSYCLVSPKQDIKEGDRIWIRDHGGATAIKRLVGMNGDTLSLRGWMPVTDGKQSSFEEERKTSYVDCAHPVVAVFKGRPGTPEVTFVPDPRDGGIAATEGLLADEFALISLHEVQAAAGVGRLNHGEAAISALAFPKVWLRRHGISARSASLIYVVGDSMAPALKDGAMIMINHARTEPRDRRIYAFRIGDELRVKRLELLGDGQLLITSDNPAIPTEAIANPEAEDIEVIGEVVWSGNTI